MPKIIKKTTAKKTGVKKKNPVDKTKKTAVKKNVKPLKTAKTHKILKPATLEPVVSSQIEEIEAPKQLRANQITVDVISDDESEFLDKLETNDPAPSFSNWPDFKKEEIPEKHFSPIANNFAATKEEEEEMNDSIDEEYDKQKKFFSDWATQIAPQNGEEKPRVAPRGKSLGLYRRMAFKFIIATLVLLGFVFYFFFPKLSITIIPQSETINDSFSFTVGDTASASNDSTDASSTTNVDANVDKKINGVVKELTIEAEKTYPASSEAVSGEETINGQVVIVNKYNKAQPLVAKTRLLSPDGKLFRIQDSINVPAGGEVTVAIYADKPGSEMALSAGTRFTIPGLWAGLQEQIYAENKSDFTFASKSKYTVTEKDIELAKGVITDVLNLEAKNEVDTLKQGQSNKIVIYSDVPDSVNYIIDSKVGDEKPQFTIKASKKVVIINFSKDAVSKMAEARLSLLVPDDKQLAGFDGNQITYSPEGYDVDTNTATVKAYFSASMFLKSDSSLLDKKKMVGLNRKQLSKYLDSFLEIKSYDLKFSPSFISSAPSLPDKISISVQKIN
jgi:hypothetical protein